jgi:two-component system, OmpR family, response regulator
MKLLVIEDDIVIADSLKKGLTQESFVVDVAYDGEMGLDLALSGDFDLMILDLMLPKIDGVSICREVRKEGLKTPILILTAKDQVKDKVGLLDMGADDYLTKPFAFEELLARVRALARRPHDLNGETLRIADLILNTHTYQVSRNDHPITLSSKEYSLLEYLLRNPNKTMSKDSIIRHVWGYDTDILPNTVEVYIRYLRSKIDSPFEKPLLHTVRGFGYRLGDL